MSFKEYTAKTVSDAITEATMDLGITSDRLEYEVIDKGSAGFIGIGSRPAKIKAREKSATNDIVKEIKEKVINEKKESKESNEAKEVKQVKEVKTAEKKTSNLPNSEVEKIIRDFLAQVFVAMKLEVEVSISFDEESVNVDLAGNDMGMLIGKRGQTLDSLQYLVSLVVNKSNEGYLRVKVDTENYRERRKKTLENLAKNVAFKVKRTKRPVSLEPMNPYERRVIHSALQNDRYVFTKSEGEEPYRHVVVMLKR